MCYTINPQEGSRLDYKLTIVDTPAFGDRRGLERDNQLVYQIRELFSSTGTKGVTFIDAVCFLIKAPDARLTATQKYIYHAIMALFGQDIEKNICSLITFADGQEPPVLAALVESGLPFGKFFTLNNSALFAKNAGLATTSLSPGLPTTSLSPMFWDMSVSSYRQFFDFLKTMEPNSLSLTKEVIDERRKLELNIATLQPQVDAALSKISAIKKEMKIIDQHKAEIQVFEYEVEETRQRKTELPKGEYVTNCLNCHITCGKSFADDPRQCRAMDKTGNCTVCSSKCHWTNHKNSPYIFEFETVKVKKTYAEKLKKHQAASEQLLNAEKVLEKMSEEVIELQDIIEDIMNAVSKSKNRLKEIALRPNPLTVVEHIDLLIEAEKMEKREGWQGRIAALQEYRQKAEITKRVEHLNKEAAGTRHPLKDGTRRKQKSSFLSYLQK